MRRDAASDRSIALMKFLSGVARRLGVAKDVYVVGGAVRNFLIDRPIKDVDVVIDSVRAGKDSEWFAKQVAKVIPVPTNLTTNQYGVAILTVKGDWEVDGQNLAGEVIEIANARQESYGGETGKGYKPHMVEPSTIEEDVIRREFTYNTLMWRLLDLANGPDKAEIIDLTGCGMRDLQNRETRCPRDPDVVFADDPTRLLRAIKFVAKYGFKIPPDLAAAIRKNAPKMKRAPYEAIATILVRDVLNQPTAKSAVKLMKSLGLLDVISEMVQEDTGFSSYLSRQLAKDRKVDLLLDLLDLGLRVKSPVSFLSRPQQARLREITTPMPEGKAEEFLKVLTKPPLDNMAIIERFNIPPRERGSIKTIAQDVMLANPELAWNSTSLFRAVVKELGRMYKSAAPPKGKWWKSLSVGDWVDLRHSRGWESYQIKDMTSKRVWVDIDGERRSFTWANDGMMRPSTRRHAASKYDHIDFKPPQSVADAAAKGLEYRQKASPSNRGGLTTEEAGKEGIGSGVQRAVNLKNRDTVSPETIKKMHGFFARHEKNKAVSPENKDTPWNDKGHVAWLLWGGDAGKAWVDKIMKQMQAADEKARTANLREAWFGKQADAKGKIPGGFAEKEKIKPEDVDPKELAMGIEVEREHLVGGGYSEQEMHDMAQEIALDHLAEIKDYYTRLKAMEAEAEGKKEAGLGREPVTGDGKSAGLFIPLPNWLAEQYPDLDQDGSPSHVTLLYAGEVPPEREEEFVEIIRDILGKEPGPIQAWTQGVDCFRQTGKDETVYYTPIHFSRDIGEIKDRLWVALEAAKFEIRDKSPMAYFPHATLEYRPGLFHEHGYDKPAPDGAWEFDSVQIWGLPNLYDIPLGSYIASDMSPEDVEDYNGKKPDPWLKERQADLRKKWGTFIK